MADPVPPSPPPPPSARPRLSRVTLLKAALIAVGVLVVVAVVFYLVGRSKGAAPIPELEARASAAEAQFAAVQDRAKLNEALALVYRTTMDLDARNFGTANEHLHAAARALDGLSGVDGNGVDGLRRTMAETDLTVAADLQQQRARVLHFAEQIESLLQGGTAAGAPTETE